MTLCYLGGARDGAGLALAGVKWVPCPDPASAQAAVAGLSQAPVTLVLVSAQVLAWARAPLAALATDPQGPVVLSLPDPPGGEEGAP